MERRLSLGVDVTPSECAIERLPRGVSIRACELEQTSQAVVERFARCELGRARHLIARAIDVAVDRIGVVRLAVALERSLRDAVVAGGAVDRSERTLVACAVQRECDERPVARQRAVARHPESPRRGLEHDRADRRDLRDRARDATAVARVRQDGNHARYVELAALCAEQCRDAAVACARAAPARAGTRRSASHRARDRDRDCRSSRRRTSSEACGTRCDTGAAPPTVPRVGPRPQPRVSTRPWADARRGCAPHHRYTAPRA